MRIRVHFRRGLWAEKSFAGSCCGYRYALITLPLRVIRRGDSFNFVPMRGGGRELLVDIRVLLAEDEANIRRLIAGYLIREGFKVIEADDGEEALEKFDGCPQLNLVILDVMMPKLDGYEVCKRIRKTSDIPVLMLTARDTEYDELFGFDCGADEYISKPFSPSILVTRIKALLKRTSVGDMQDLTFGGLKLSYRSRAVTVDGREAVLTPKEFDLLYYLMMNKELALSRDQIISAVWEMDYDGDDRTVDTHVKCLRSKLGPYGDCIATVRKVGYKFEYKG